MTVYPTQSQGDCTRRVNAAASEGFDRIIAGGGDGMLHELIVGAVSPQFQTVTGYIPTGTVNDFVASHGIPKNINEAAENAVLGTVTAIDVGQFNQTYFSYVAAFGMVTHVSYSTDQQLKNRLGSFAYLIEILKSVDLKHFDEASCFMEVTADDLTFSGEFIFGAVTNSTSLVSSKNFFPQDVKFDAGLLEGIFIKRPKNLIELDQLKLGLINKSFNASCIVCVKAANFHMKTEKEIAWTLDGENGGSHDSVVSINVVPRAIRIALPNTSEELL